MEVCWIMPFMKPLIYAIKLYLIVTSFLTTPTSFSFGNFTVIIQVVILHSHVHEVGQSSISPCINVFGMLSEFVSTVYCIATNNYASPSGHIKNLRYSRRNRIAGNPLLEVVPAPPTCGD